MLNYEFGIAFGIVSGIGSFVGTLIIQRILDKTNRPSILVFVLFLVLIISTILIPGNALIQIIEELKLGKNIWEFDSPC